MLLFISKVVLPFYGVGVLNWTVVGKKNTHTHSHTGRAGR